MCLIASPDGACYVDVEYQILPAEPDVGVPQRTVEITSVTTEAGLVITEESLEDDEWVAGVSDYLLHGPHTEKY